MASEQVNVKDRIKQFQAIAPPKKPSRVQDTAGPVKQRISRQMDESPLFREAAQFIYTDKETGQLRCDEQTVKLLSEIKQPLNVVAITGQYRTGKSYLLNRLLGEKGGFHTGHCVHACTKGIWVRCRHHPIKEGQVLLLLDVEGFGDIDKVNGKEDTWLFTLATVLSSTLVYNNTGLIDKQALDRLKFLEDIDSTIQVSQDKEDQRFFDFDFFFPSLVVTIRDVRLLLGKNPTQKVTPDEYFENTLVQKRGEGRDVEAYNKIRLLIRRYFKKRKCFTFMTPCGPSQELEKLADRDVQPEFLESVQEFSNYIYKCQALQLKSGREINGRMFANLAMHYVSAIGQNKQPSILEATKYMVQTENQATVVAASELYKKKMQQCITNMGDHVPRDTSLINFHQKCLSEALDYFQQHVVFDDEEVFREDIMNVCKGLLGRFKHNCDEQSTRTCANVLTRLNRKVENKLKNGAYCCESGYDEYLKDINWICKQYTNMSGLGSKSKEVLQAFLDGKHEEEHQIHQMVVGKQTELKGTVAIDPSEKPTTRNTDFSSQIRRRESFGQSLQLEINKMEKDLNETLVQKHAQGKKAIKEKYLENLTLKINELYEQKSEKRENIHEQKQIDEEIEYLKKIYEYAVNIDEKEEKSGIPSEEMSKGSRPTTLGAEQETIFDEAYRPRNQGKKWCRIQ